MAENSANIIVLTGGGLYYASALYLDGLPSDAGPKLMALSAEPDALALVKLGTLYSLGTTLEEKDGTVAFARDKHHPWRQTKYGMGESEADAIGGRHGVGGVPNYTYRWENHEWTCNGMSIQAAIDKQNELL